MDRLLIASIIQGEAGVMGPAGMLFVALVLQHRIWDCGHSEARVAREWYGRAGPSEEALRLADLVLEGRLPSCEYYYCMGGKVDVERFNWEPGDAICIVGGNSIHLYKEWPEEDDDSRTADDNN